MGKIFQAKLIVTMEASHPYATHVAVDGDKIVGLGNEEVVKIFPDFEVDSNFSNNIILPGFVEGHAHMVAGQDGLAPYVGFFDRPSPEGTTLKGLKSMDEVISYLQEEDKKLPEGAPLIAIGFDPIYFDSKRPTKTDLDKVSTSRMVMLNHVSGHLITVNSKVVDAIPIDKLNTQGVAKGEDGKPTGELQEIGAMSIAFSLMGAEFAKFTDPKILFPRYMKLAQMAGVTTITEMGVD
ncbi:MAG: amidohydrolase family protein, partial [Candidatus Levybacteria bacterium]|nr:amidohydrolase family protein [Candidatus Levybacteria bacterium]